MTRRLEPSAKIVVASHNPGKVWEIKQLIAPYGLDAVSAGDLGLDEPEETETTFIGNAELKSRHAAKGANLPALADDSGLEVDCLDGAPGIYSARWAGPAKDFSVAMKKLADEISARDAWSPSPRANFTCALSLAWPDGETQNFEGKVFGHLVWPPRGGNGFGYDPMFVADGKNQTFGEMEPEQKYAISHRTRAFALFKKACLEGLALIEPRTTEGRDLEAFTAAARNLSTRDELVSFIANLRKDQLAHGDDWGAQSLPDFLSALEKSLAALDVSEEEPRWRVLAKALFDASR
jgi:XTP/dITP diphosphohydrolase